MFTGLSAFLLTPLNDEHIDESRFLSLISRLVEAGVDSIGVLGSTGNYMYLDRAERKRVIELAVREAGHVPIMASVSALRTRDVLQLVEDAQYAGASAVLLAPVAYHPLTEEEAFALYTQVSRQLSVSLCVYDNPRLTNFTFSDALHGRIAKLSQVKSVKIPGMTNDPTEVKNRVDHLRAVVPDPYTVGISGDRFAATGLNAGCDVWYSVLGGLFPRTCLELTRHAQAGRGAEALRLSEQLNPIWDLFAQYGGIRTAAAIAIYKGWVSETVLPAPLSPISLSHITNLADLLDDLE